MKTIMYIEISKTSGLQKIWTSEDIKNAFAFGCGTEKDFKKYMENNKQFCKFEKVSNQIA